MRRFKAEKTLSDFVDRILSNWTRKDMTKIYGLKIVTNSGKIEDVGFKVDYKNNNIIFYSKENQNKFELAFGKDWDSNSELVSEAV